MTRGISEIAGRGINSKGVSVMVYRTLRSLLCASCPGNIAEGVLFTRHKVGNMCISPHCRDCVNKRLELVLSFFWGNRFKSYKMA
jgi:hypothetical protein